jgi:hypothetical protein
MQVRSISTAVLAWTVAWSIAAVITGMLTANADVPHLPRPLGLIVFGFVGALAGLCASLIFLLLRRVTGESARPATWRTFALATAAGGLATLILAPVIGVPRLTACIAGAAAGALSGCFALGRSSVSANSR